MSQGTPVFQLREFIIFVALGGIAAAANYLSRFAFDVIMPFEAAVVLAYLVGMVIAFTTFQRAVFKDAKSSQRQQVFRFCIVNLVGVILAVMVSTLMARLVLPAIGWTFYPHSLAHAVGIGVPATSSYFGHKHYTYKS